MVEFGTSFTFRGWVRVRVMGYGSGVRGRKVKSRDCALASDLVRATFSCLTLRPIFTITFNGGVVSLGKCPPEKTCTPRAPSRDF